MSTIPPQSSAIVTEYLRSPEAVPGHAVPMAYAMGRANQNGHFSNGMPINFTSNPFYGNGSDPNSASWTGLNVGLDETLPATVQGKLANILSNTENSMAKLRGSQVKSSILNAMANPRVAELTQQGLQQGLSVEEAQTRAIAQLTHEAGQAGGFMATLPSYEKAYKDRVDAYGAAAIANGAKFDAPTGAFGVNPTIQSYGQDKDGNIVLRTGQAQITMPKQNVAAVIGTLSRTPVGRSALGALFSGQNLSKEQLEALRHAQRVELDRYKTENNIYEALQRDKLKSNAKGSNANVAAILG